MGSSWTVAGRHAWAGAVASVQQATASKPGLAASRAAPQQGGPRLPRRGYGGSQLAAHDGGKVAAVHAAHRGRVRRRLRQRRALRGRAAERLGGRAVEVGVRGERDVAARARAAARLQQHDLVLARMQQRAGHILRLLRPKRRPVRALRARATPAAASGPALAAGCVSG